MSHIHFQAARPKHRAWKRERVSYTGTARISASLLAMGMLVGSAYGQGGEKANVTTPAPSNQAVTFTDLEGAKIHAKLVTDMEAQRQGRQGPVTQEADWQIDVQPEEMISFNFRATSHTLRGTKTSPVRARTVKLEEPWSTPDGEAVWQFKDGDLTFVRSYQGGAVRTIVSLKRDGQNLTCAANTIFARERGKNGILLNSAIDGAPVTILNWKPVSSSCEVTAKKPDSADAGKPAAAEGTSSSKRSQ
jgi:hypothetical protein